MTPLSAKKAGPISALYVNNLCLVLDLVARCYKSPAEKLENHYNSTAKTQNST